MLQGKHQTLLSCLFLWTSSYYVYRVFQLKTWCFEVLVWLGFWIIGLLIKLGVVLSSGNLCLINHLKLFWPHLASMASDRKGAKIQHEFSWFCQNIFFSKHQNKVILVLKLLNSRTWKTLKSTVVIFQALETSPASKAQFPQKTSWSWWSDHHWHQNDHYW